MKKKPIRMQGLFSYKYNTSRIPKVFAFGSESETYPTVPDGGAVQVETTRELMVVAVSLADSQNRRRMASTQRARI
jgi:hypothetical protein